MNTPRVLRWIAGRPVPVVAAVALAVGLTSVFTSVALNPLVLRPQLDGDYYLAWARDIASGDLLGTGGNIGGQVWVLNPLYAYVLAPLVAAFRAPLLPILIGQAVLAAGTAALSAGAARRFFGCGAAWVAGLLVAFAAPLAQLGCHVSVAGLSAFLVAGSCYAFAPAAEGDRGRAHGPVAGGVWLGIGALARPITPLALPFAAWRYARESKSKVRTFVVVVAAFLACAVPSFVRNVVVTGEPILYTGGASGMNLHLGNNGASRETLSMTSAHFRFNPVLMYEDGRRYVHEAIGRAPTRAEVGDWFTRMWFDEITFRAPLGSVVFYAHKARWFFGPVEIPSSASFESDRAFNPWLRIAFVPAWLIASLALAGAWACRRRPEVLLGPGALALAHWGVLTLVFPLSHYRAPVLPALAVLGAGAVAAAWDAARSGRRGAAAGVGAVAVGTALLGVAPPQPDPLHFRDQAVIALHYRDSNPPDLEMSQKYAYAALEANRAYTGTYNALGWELAGEIEFRRRRWEQSVESFTKALKIDPSTPHVYVFRAYALERLGRYPEAIRDCEHVIDRWPFLPDGWIRLGEIFTLMPDRTEDARRLLRKGREMGGEPDEGAMRRVGLVQ